MARWRWDEDGILSRQLVLSLYLPATVLALGQSMIAPVLPNLTRSYGVGLSEASLVFVAFGAGAVAATFPAERDRASGLVAPHAAAASNAPMVRT